MGNCRLRVMRLQRQFHSSINWLNNSHRYHWLNSQVVQHKMFIHPIDTCSGIIFCFVCCLHWIESSTTVYILYSSYSWHHFRLSIGHTMHAPKRVQPCLCIIEMMFEKAEAMPKLNHDIVWARIIKWCPSFDLWIMRSTHVHLSLLFSNIVNIRLFFIV